MNPNRVKFFSVHDGAWLSNMELAEEVLENFSIDNEYDINDIIELYQIKLYIDNDIFRPKWTVEYKEEIKEKIKRVWSLIVQFWNQINNENLTPIFNQLECWTIQDRFWEITTKLSAYKRFDKESFSRLLKLKSCNIQAVLHHEKLVKYFDNEIKTQLLNSDTSAELLLSQYVEQPGWNRADYFFPKCLSLEDRERIILNYLEQENLNLNYVRLTINIKNSEQLKISNKTRLKAIELEEKLTKDFFAKNEGFSYGVKVGFKTEQKEPVLIKRIGNTDFYSYGVQYLMQYDDPIFLLSHFKFLFNYLDSQNCISLVSKHYHFDSIEKIKMRSRNEYFIGPKFNIIEKVSFYQIYSYDKILLKEMETDIEAILSYYINENLKKHGLAGFKFNLPSKGTSYFERIRTLLAEFDVFLRQYKMYVEDGEINRRLLNISPEPYSFSQIPSFVNKKYCYLKKDKLTRAMILLFSDQSSLNYIESLKDSRFRNFYNLISNENVLYEYIEDYQKDSIKHLFDHDLLFIDNEGVIRALDEDQLFVLRQLYFEGVINYWHYSQNCRRILDKMNEDGIEYFEDTLFCKSECSYLNYYLNDKEFTNGPKLRNHFAHGTNSSSEDELIKSYYNLLRIMVLTILKIDDDLYIKNTLMSYETNKSS